MHSSMYAYLSKTKVLRILHETTEDQHISHFQFHKYYEKSLQQNLAKPYLFTLSYFPQSKASCDCR